MQYLTFIAQLQCVYWVTYVHPCNFPIYLLPITPIETNFAGGPGRADHEHNEVGNFYSHFKKEFFDSPIYEYNRVIHFLKL